MADAVGYGFTDCVTMDCIKVYQQHQEKFFKTIYKKFGEKVGKIILQGFLHFNNKSFVLKTAEKDKKITELQEEIRKLDVQIKQKHHELKETANRLEVCRRSVRIKIKKYPAPPPPSATSTGEKMTTCDTTAKSNISNSSEPRDSHPSRQSKLPWDNVTLRRLQLQDSRWRKIIYEKEKCNNRNFKTIKCLMECYFGAIQFMRLKILNFVYLIKL